MPAMTGQTARELLMLAMGLGAGGASRAASVLSSVSGGNGGNAGNHGGPGSAFTAREYPTQFAPGAWHEYGVVQIPGKANYNQMGKANLSTIEEAGVMQDLELHNRTITKYLRPGMTPQEQRAALNRGLQEEKNLPQFWNESASRRPFSVSSSAVSGIRLTPDARIEVAWQSNPSKWYTFRQYPNTYEASKAAQELLKADSIGRAVYPVVSKGIGVRGDLGAWNAPNYDAGMA